jgi:hypothetical protein
MFSFHTTPHTPPLLGNFGLFGRAYHLTYRKTPLPIQASVQHLQLLLITLDTRLYELSLGVA